MKLHKNAALTPKQRQEIKELYATGKYKKVELARRFCTTEKTIAKWLKRDDIHDYSSAPKNHYTVVTQEYEDAVLEYRKNHEDHGPKRIAYELKDEISGINPSTVYQILKRANKINPIPTTKREKKN